MNCERNACTLLLSLLLAGIFPLAPVAGSAQDGRSVEAAGSGHIIDVLTEEEHAWLQDHPVITVAHDPDWAPVEFSDERGELTGMSGDYLNLVEQRLGLKFKRIPNLSWQEAFARQQRWEIDMATCVAAPPVRYNFWAFTKPYLSIPIVIATRSDVGYIGEMKELFGKPVAVVKNYAIDDWVTRDFPEIPLARFNTVPEGLAALQRGEVFAYLDNLLIIGDYQAKLKVTNIKIAGQTPYVNAQRMAVRKDWAPLAGILDKALDSISETERQDIYRKWVPLRYEHGFDYALLWKALAGFAVILAGLIIWIRKLSREIASRQRAEAALRESQEKYQHLIETTDTGYVIIDHQGRVTDANQEYMRLTGRLRREEVLGHSVLEWTAPQDHARNEAAVRRCAEQGFVRNLEIGYVTPSGQVTPVEINATVLGHGASLQILSLCRDITERKQAELKLRESESLYHDLVETSQDLIWQCDAEGRFIYLNPAWEGVFGYRLDEILGRSLADFQSPECAARDAREFARLLQGGSVRAYETVHRAKDGRALHLVFNAKSVTDEAGRILGTRGTAYDITERKRAEEELAHSDALMRYIIEHNRSAVAVHDREMRYLYVSQRYLDDYQVKERDIIGKHHYEVFPDLPQKWRDVHRQVLTGKVMSAEDDPYEKADGSVEWTRWECRPWYEAEGSIGGLIVYTEVITERKRAEADLRTAHQTFLTVLDGIDATIYVADMDTHEILFMNKHMVDDFGAGLTGRKCHEVFREQSEPCGHCTNDQLLDVDGNPAGVCVWETKNPITGKYYINYDRAIRWVDGRMVRLQIATDISKLKELERERGRIEEQLQQAQKMESVGRLAGGVAHDFNNMLSAILGHAELAMMQYSPSGPLLEDLKAIRQAAQRSADLVRQLLAFARKQTVAPKVLDFNDTVSGMLKLLLRLIGEDIDLVWMPGTGLWPVKIDPSQIDQLLANLCVNARDAIVGVGKVIIETENIVFDEAYCAVHPDFACGDYVMLAVSDDGCGMKKEILDHLFEPFFTTKELGKGTGLGLATVYGIVKQNEGFINVYSEPDKGTTFRIYLPRFVGDAIEPMAASPAETSMGRGETVLVVEDEAAILNLGRVMLERLGYTVVTAGTPGEALRQAEAHAAEIQLLITDVVMPEMNGRDLMKLIRDIKPGLKCLFTSGYTANVIAHHGVLDKGVNFLQKPFSMKELASKVRQALERD